MVVSAWSTDVGSDSVQTTTSALQQAFEQGAVASCGTPGGSDTEEVSQHDLFHGSWDGGVCLPLCSNATQGHLSSAAGCVHAFELVRMHATPHDALFVTNVVDTTISARGEYSSRAYVTPYEQAMLFGFRYVISIPGEIAALHGLTSSVMEMTSSNAQIQLTSDDDIQTRLLSYDGSVRRIFQPGDFMHFTLSEIRELSGADKSKTGMAHEQIQLTVECNVQYNEWEMLTCDARFASSPHWGASRNRLMLDGTLRSYYGMEVKVRGVSSFETLDFGQCWAALIAFFVLWRLPQAVISIIASYLLGHSSTIYKKVLVERFHISDYIIGLVMRLLIGSQGFKGIAGDDGVISLAEMDTVLRTVFHGREREHEIDEVEIDVISTYCYDQLRRNSNSPDVDLDGLNFALLAREPLTYEDIVHVFNVDRSKTWLERMFQPREFRHLSDHLHELAGQISPMSGTKTEVRVILESEGSVNTLVPGTSRWGPDAQNHPPRRDTDDDGAAPPESNQPSASTADSHARAFLELAVAAACRERTRDVAMRSGEAAITRLNAREAQLRKLLADLSDLAAKANLPSAAPFHAAAASGENDLIRHLGRESNLGSPTTELPEPWDASRFSSLRGSQSCMALAYEIAAGTATREAVHDQAIHRSQDAIHTLERKFRELSTSMEGLFESLRSRLVQGGVAIGMTMEDAVNEVERRTEELKDAIWAVLLEVSDKRSV